MKVTKTKLTAAAAAIAMIAGVTALIVAARGDSAPPGLSRVSAQGTPVAFTPAVVAKLHLGSYGPVSLLSSHGKAQFYRLDNGSPHPCFAVGRADAPYPIGQISCRIAEPYFPSPEKPVMDLSSVEIDIATNQAHFIRVEGVAADAVASVHVLAKDGSVVEKIPVVNNVYAANAVPRTGVGLAAVDADGNVLARIL
jgi:hypothetical protein